MKLEQLPGLPPVALERLLSLRIKTVEAFLGRTLYYKCRKAIEQYTEIPTDLMVKLIEDGKGLVDFGRKNIEYYAKFGSLRRQDPPLVEQKSLEDQVKDQEVTIQRLRAALEAAVVPMEALYFVYKLLHPETEQAVLKARSLAVEALGRLKKP